MNTQGERYSVAETAARCGISTSALTRYVKRGLIPAPQRQGGKRTYSAETIARIPTIRAALLDARIKKLAKAPAVPIPDGRLSVRETANQAGISVSELGILKRQGVIPQPERYGRSLTYGAGPVPVIKAIMEQRKLATERKRSKSMKELWKDQDYRDLATFGMSKPKRRKPQTFSAEFLGHQGQLKDPKVWKKAKKGQQRFLNDPQRYGQWIEALTIAANRPSVRLRRSAKMKIGIAVERAELQQRRHQGGIKPQPLGDQIRDLLTQGCKPKEIKFRLMRKCSHFSAAEKPQQRAKLQPSLPRMRVTLSAMFPIRKQMYSGSQRPSQHPNLLQPQTRGHRMRPIPTAVRVHCARCSLAWATKICYRSPVAEA